MMETNTIIQGDCLEVMRGMADNSVDLVLTDPPYGLDKRLSSGGGKHKDAKFRKAYEGKTWDKLIDQEVFDEMFRISKNQIIFGANYYSMPPTRGIICWDKRQFMPTFSRWEYAWTSFDRPARLYERRVGQERRYHPTQKPVELFSQLLKDFSDPDMLICDPFAGSGTSCIAAELMGRRYIGIEISEEYCKIARKRVQEAKDSMGLFK